MYVPNTVATEWIYCMYIFKLYLTVITNSPIELVTTQSSNTVQASWSVLNHSCNMLKWPIYTILLVESLQSVFSFFRSLCETVAIHVPVKQQVDLWRLSCCHVFGSEMAVIAIFQQIKWLSILVLGRFDLSTCFALSVGSLSCCKNHPAVLRQMVDIQSSDPFCSTDLKVHVSVIH